MVGAIWPGGGGLLGPLRGIHFHLAVLYQRAGAGIRDAGGGAVLYGGCAVDIDRDSGGIHWADSYGSEGAAAVCGGGVVWIRGARDGGKSGGGWHAKGPGMSVIG